MHALPVAAENVLGLESCESTRWQEPQQRMDADLLAGCAEVCGRSQRIGADENPLLRPPKGGLAPEAAPNDREHLKRGPGNAVERDIVERHPEPGGQGGAVASVAVEEPDYASLPTEHVDPLLDTFAVDRIDYPDALPGEERVRGALHERRLGRDPAEAAAELVAEANAPPHRSRLAARKAAAASAWSTSGWG